MGARIDLRRFEPVEPIDWPERLSMTLLRHADKCPRSAYLYMKYRGGKASHPMDRGTAFHVFAERAVRLLIDNHETTIPPDLCLEIMEEVLADHELGLVVPEGEKAELRAMAWNFGDWTWINPEEVVALETMFEVELGGWPVVGKIDLALRLGGVVLDVRDYKTRFGMADQEEIDKGFQGNLYLVGAAFGRVAHTNADNEIVGYEDEPLGAGVNRFRFAEVYPLTVWEAEGTLAYRDISVDRDYLTNRRRSLEGAVALFEQRLGSWDFPARDGAHCKICPARWECPILNAVEGELRDPLKVLDGAGQVATEEEARAAAARWWWAGKIREAEWKGVRAWGENNGSLRFGDDLILEWKPVPETRRKKSQEELEAGIANAIEKGMPFVWDEFFAAGIYTRYTLRTLTAGELEAEGK